MFKLLNSYANFPCQQGTDQNPSSQASVAHEQELPDVQAGLGNTVKPEIKLPTFTGSWRKQGNFRKRKKPTSVSLTMLKPLTCG